MPNPMARRSSGSAKSRPLVKTKTKLKPTPKTKTKTKAKAKPVKRAAKHVEPIKPIKAKFTKTSLNTHLAETSEVDVRDVKKVMAALEATMLGTVAPRGMQEFMLSGLFKISTRKIPAKKVPAIKKGELVMNPGLGKKVPHPGRAAFTKPATVRVKIRALSKLKNAALS